MRTSIVCAAFWFSILGVPTAKAEDPDQIQARFKEKGQTGTYAIFHTTMGNFVVKLHRDKAPVTVKNFVDLAMGEKKWKDPKTGEMVKRPYYNGLVFHRVIPDFMIQGGCPMGNGRGGPGYQFEDEFRKDLRHDSKGILSMANSGPNTNGSQFFITVAPTPFLDGKHTVFGKVIEGYPVVEDISRVGKDANDKPLKPVVMERVTVIQVE